MATEKRLIGCGKGFKHLWEVSVELFLVSYTKDWLEQNLIRSVPTEKGKTMTDREKLIELLIGAGNAVADKYIENMGMSYAEQKQTEADYLISHGVTFTPAIPGPSDADPNIMELCFHNGERHMKEKVCQELTRIGEHMPCITVAQAIAMLEGL